MRRLQPPEPAPLPLTGSHRRRGPTPGTRIKGKVLYQQPLGPPPPRPPWPGDTGSSSSANTAATLHAMAAAAAAHTTVTPVSPREALSLMDVDYAWAARSTLRRTHGDAHAFGDCSQHQERCRTPDAPTGVGGGLHYTGDRVGLPYYQFRPAGVQAPTVRRQQHPACRSAAGRGWTPPPDGPLRRSWSAAPPDKLRRAHTPPVGVDRWRGGDPHTPLGARLLHAAVRKGEAEYQPIRPMPVLPV